MDNTAFLIAALGAYLVVILVIGIACYVIASLAHMKALKAMGYDKAWMAWIPYAQQYALADAAARGQENITLFGSVSVPAALYKFWWAVMLAVQVLGWIISPLVSLMSLVSLALQIIFLGNCYVKIYAELDGTDEKDQQVIGYLSGFLVIIAVIKFLFGKYESKVK